MFCPGAIFFVRADDEFVQAQHFCPGAFDIFVRAQRPGQKNDRHQKYFIKRTAGINPLPPAYGLYARENVDNCERPLNATTTMERCVSLKPVSTKLSVKPRMKVLPLDMPKHFGCFSRVDGWSAFTCSDVASINKTSNHSP